MTTPSPTPHAANRPRAEWRLARRLAWRDMRRHRGRTALAGLLIALPLLVLAGALTGIRTLEVSTAESDARTYSIAKATLTFNSNGTRTDQDGRARALPGMSRPATDDNPAPIAAVRTVSGAPVASMATTSVITSGGHHTGYDVYEQVAGDARLWHSQFALVSGRWPTSDHDVLVTQRGHGLGLPTSGAVSVSEGRTSRSFTVVGVVSSYDSAALVGTAAPRYPGSATFLLTQTGPADVWGQYGGQLMGPSSEGEANPWGDVDAGAATVVLVLTIGVVALLAGPAFAASATRSRRALGLVASNGAEPATLRRIVLVQALFIGALSATVGIALGAALGAWAALHATWFWPQLVSGPLDVPWPELFGLLLVASVSSLVAALAPAVAAGRTNLLHALRGQVSARTVRRSMPWTGALLVALGVGLLYVKARQVADDVSSDSNMTLIVGIPAFLIGAVMLTPGLLTLWGRAAPHLPVAPRVALRTISRRRTGSTAAIGAVFAASTALMTVAVFAASIDPHMRRTYAFTAPMNSARLSFAGDAQQHASAAKIRAALPRALMLGLSNVGIDTATAYDESEKGPHHTIVAPFFDVATCTPDGVSHSAGSGVEPLSLSSSLPSVVAIDSASSAFTRLSPAQRSVLASGGALVVIPSHEDESWGNESPTPLRPSDIHTGHITLTRVAASGLSDPSGSSDGLGATHVACSSSTIPAATVEVSAFGHLPLVNVGTAVVTTSTALAHHLPRWGYETVITTPGALTAVDEAKLSATVDPTTNVYVERGYSSPLTAVLWISSAAAALIILLAAVISTLLSVVESRDEDTTLAAVGASRSLRRRIAAAHAWLIALLGTLMGLALGAGPGIVLAVANTSKDDSDPNHRLDPIVRVPWPQLGLVVIVVPLIAAAVVALCVRRTPVIVRRNTLGG